MYSNLRFAIDKEGLAMDDLAQTLNVHRNTIANKISGSTPWTYDEVLLIQKVHFPHYDQGWLFRKVPQAS